MSLSSLFAQQRATVVEWEGAPLFALLEIDAIPTSIVVKFLRAATVPTQGLELKVAGGILSANGVEADSIVLWADTAPIAVPIEVRAQPDGPGSLKVWNVWRGKSGVKHAWIGNAGMRVTWAGGTVTLRCSDGEGLPHFDDLEVALEMT